MQDCGSTKYGTIRKASFDINIIGKEADVKTGIFGNAAEGAGS